MEIKDFIFFRAFCQADVVKGFRYLDLAGQIVNSYIEELPEYRVDASGLAMRSTAPVRGGIAELQLSPHRIWLRFDRPPTLTFVADQAAKRFLSISETLEVSKYARIGFRVQILWPVAESAAATMTLARRSLSWEMTDWQTVGPLENVLIQTRHSVGDGLHCLVRLTLARRTEADGFVGSMDADLPEHVLFVDVDCYSNDLVAEQRAIGRFFDRSMRLFNEGLMTFMSPIVEALT